MMRSRWMAAAAFGALMLASGPTLAQDAAPATASAPVSTGLSLRDLAMMERVSEPRVSPDGRHVLYAVRTTDWDGNKGANSLWLADVAGGEPRRLAISEGGVSGARWAPDGQAIYFLSSRGGSNQVWRADRAGMAAAQVTTLPFDVSGFRIAPDGRSLVLALSVFVDCETLACTRTRLDERGIRRVPVTLHVGAGTFLPVKVEDIRDHRMHAEIGHLDAATAEALVAQVKQWAQPATPLDGYPRSELAALGGRVWRNRRPGNTKKPGTPFSGWCSPRERG